MTNSDDPTSSTLGSAAALALFASVGDPEGTRTITSIVVLLAVLGVALVMIAIWLFRLTRPDKELLAPLEVMGERKWRRADPVWQRRRLDEVRPPGAQPLQPSAAPPDFDEAFFEHAPGASGFDDLHDDAHPSRESPPQQSAEEVVAGEPGGAGAAPVEVPADVAPADRDRTAAVITEAVPPPAMKPISPTPTGIERPMDLPERELDPEVMAAAMAELDAELQRGRDGTRETPDSPVN